MVYRPAWFRDDKVFVSFAETVGINKDGNTLYVIDAATGTRTERVDDQVASDIDALLADESAATSRWIPRLEFSVAVPAYYSEKHRSELEDLLSRPEFSGLEARSIGSLVRDGLIEVRAGHGSPPSDLRNGTVPYIKVSDIRAGQVNINPTNMVPQVVAKRFWRDETSGLQPFDLVTPSRASKNIGEFAVLMPGQEQVLFTKEVLIVRPSDDASVDSFYLAWALSLTCVREQWKRVVFMQTNREDVGQRYLEIEIPWPVEEGAGTGVSQPFRDYYLGLELIRTRFVDRLAEDGVHHVFLAAASVGEEESDETAAGSYRRLEESKDI